VGGPQGPGGRQATGVPVRNITLARLPFPSGNSKSPALTRDMVLRNGRLRGQSEALVDFSINGGRRTLRC
jgi:hypothetical protein